MGRKSNMSQTDHTSKIYDAIIIGAGIHGISLAFHLSKAGLRPLLLERQFIGAGATGRSSGLVRMHYDLEPESRLAWVSFQYFRDWEEIVGGDCGYTRTGFLHITSSEYSDKLVANVAMHQKIGIPSFVIGGDDVQRLAPGFYTDDIRAAAFEPESGYADPYATSNSMLAAARQLGAELIQGCTVTAVHQSGGRIQGVATNQGDFSAPIVINAAGPWAAGIGRLVGLDLPVDTWRHDTMFIKRPAALHLSHPTVIDDANAMYFRSERGGLTLVGLEDQNPLGESPDGYADRAQPGFVERAFNRICKRIPAMEGGSLQSSHGGYDGITPDQRAILGPAGPEGYYLSCGFSGPGFKIAPAVGACIAEWILQGAPATVDITPFTLDRFSQGKSLQGEHAYQSNWR